MEASYVLCALENTSMEARGHYHHQPWDIWSQLKLESVVGSDHNNSSRCKIAKDSDVRNFRGLEGGGGKYLCIVQGGGGFSQLFIDLPRLVPIEKPRILFCALGNSLISLVWTTCTFVSQTPPMQCEFPLKNWQA